MRGFGLHFPLGQWLLQELADVVGSARHEASAAVVARWHVLAIFERQKAKASPPVNKLELVT